MVVGGIMYVTTANECYALDAGSGRRIWHFKRPRTKGLAGDAAAGINRGVAVAGDRVFMATDHAHLVALDRFSGKLLWDTTMADWRENYGATSAPLAVGDLVVSGTSGGDEGIRGFVAAFDQATGREVWRFWTVPRPGEPGAETWRGTAIDHPCAATWLTGTYDPALDIVYWPTGNPCPDYDGRERLGDNLYSDAILALDARSGRLKWYFQYTPHDVWDWDAQQPPVLIDATWRGQPRSAAPAREPERVLLRAGSHERRAAAGGGVREKPDLGPRDWKRRTTGAQPGPGTDAHGHEGVSCRRGRNQLVFDRVQPRNWSLLRSDARELQHLHAGARHVACRAVVLRRIDAAAAGERGQKFLRAIEIQSGAIAWELPQTGPANSWGGVLASAGGLVFFGEDSGALMAVDATTGEPLWQFQTNAIWKASPMTYVFDGRQHIAVAAGPNILAFALRE